MADNRIGFNKRTFSQVKGDLITLIEEFYPEVLSDFTDSSVGTMLLDINAGVTNTLHYNIDRAFQETQRDYAQTSQGIYNLARTLGFNIPPKRPSVTVIDYTVNVPVRGDSPDESYYPTLSPQSQVIGAGKIFENDQVIDWGSPTSNLGVNNRSIIPVKDSNGIITSYQVTKREVAFNGASKIFSRVITSNDVKSFFKLRLPESNVTEILDVILLEGTNYSGDPTDDDFNNVDVKFYEVDHLSENRVFLENPNGGGDVGVKLGIWTDVAKKFIKEYTENGFVELTFGNGNPNLDAFNSGMLKAGVDNKFFLNNYLENSSLGEKLKKDHTLFVRYRTGGGSNSNLAANTITNLGNVNMNVSGSRNDINQSVITSLRVNNPIPALGGNDGLNIEEIRNLISYNFSAQKRDVQLRDYLFQVYTMPGKFGSPFKVNVFKENNKVVIPILGKDSNGKLTNSSNTLLKTNISEYLSEFRMINDYVEIRDGRIFNLGFDVEVFVGESSDNRIANDIIRTIINYFNINTRRMNEDIFLAPLVENINNVNGVFNIISMKIFNKVGNEYSSNPVEQSLISNITGEIRPINNTIYSTEDGMFEVLSPQKDIRVFLRKKGNLRR